MGRETGKNGQFGQTRKATIRPNVEIRGKTKATKLDYTVPKRLNN